MLAKLRKSSRRVTLVLIGVGALTGCGEDDTRRDVYKTREDCLADWGNKPEDCTPATDRPRHGGGGFFFYGPMYAASAMNAWRGGTQWNGSGARPGSRAKSRFSTTRATASSARSWSSAVASSSWSTSAALKR